MTNPMFHCSIVQLFYRLFFIFHFSLFTFNCFSQGTWTQKADFGGTQTEDKGLTSPTDPRDKFIGYWTCYENSSILGHSIFTVIISKSDTNQSQILMQNFYHVGSNEKVYASVSGDSVNIPIQPICDGLYQLWGFGYMEDTILSNKIVWLYYSDDGQEIDTVNAVFTNGSYIAEIPNDEGITISPNPAKNQITLKFNVSRLKLKKEALILDLSGKEIKRIAVPAGAERININMSELANGVYFVQVKTNKETVSRKLIINN